MAYREIVIKGDEKIIKGFLVGYRAGKHAKRGLLFCEGLPIDTHHLREILHGHPHWEHIVAESSQHKAFVAAIGRVAHDLDLEIISDRRISKTYFEFRVETFARKVATSIKRFLGRPPAGVKVRHNVREHIDPDAKGVEMYSPVHDYKYAGDARAEGNIEALLRYHRKLDDHDFVEVHDIKIVN